MSSESRILNNGKEACRDESRVKMPPLAGGKKRRIDRKCSHCHLKYKAPPTFIIRHVLHGIQTMLYCQLC